MNDLLDGMALQPLTSCAIRKASLLKKVHRGIVARLALRLHINVLPNPRSLFFIKVVSPSTLSYQSPEELVVRPFGQSEAFPLPQSGRFELPVLHDSDSGLAADVPPSRLGALSRVKPGME